MTTSTLVTALYNINRETNGDGRKWSEYLEWFASTLQIKLPMAIFIPAELHDFVITNRPSNLMDITHITIMEFEDIPFYKYYSIIKNILELDVYKMHIKHNDRVECKLPEYNIIQYSKFGWLQQVVDINPFNSSHFFWIDAGISRFIDTKANRIFNNTLNNNSNNNSNKLIIQHNYLLQNYKIDENYLWDSQCLMCGTMFGGSQVAVHTFNKIVEETFVHYLVKNNWVNNEQILLAYLYAQNNKLFHIVLNDTNRHLMLFDYILPLSS